MISHAYASARKNQNLFRVSQQVNGVIERMNISLSVANVAKASELGGKQRPQRFPRQLEGFRRL
jgi:hypothetical protein